MSTIFRGDFVDFDIANEDDLLEEFLGVPRKTEKADPVKTGAVAKKVGCNQRQSHVLRSQLPVHPLRGVKKTW